MSDRGPSDRLDYPATQRNREPILDVLREVLPPTGVVLEIASGTGQHAAAFAPAFPTLQYQPTDVEEAHLASIAAWTNGIDTVRTPVRLDVREPWTVPAADAILCINMIHIAPWACTEALFAGAATCLAPGAPLFLYGPFRVAGAHTSESNAGFDESLRGRDPSWGVRDLEAVVAVAATCGIQWERTIAMPANNLSVLFRSG